MEAQPCNLTSPCQGAINPCRSWVRRLKYKFCGCDTGANILQINKEALHCASRLRVSRPQSFSRSLASNRGVRAKERKGHEGSRLQATSAINSHLKDSALDPPRDTPSTARHSCLSAPTIATCNPDADPETAAT